MIHGLLHGRLLGAAPGGAIIAHPAYANLLALKDDPTSATAVATFTVKTDGTWVGDGTGYATQSGLWYSPATVGIGTGYEVRITPTLTSGDACVISNAASAWVALTADKVAQFTLQMLTAGTLEGSYSVLVEIRIAGGGATVSTNTFTLTVTATVASGTGGTCVCDDMFIRTGLLAASAQPGDLFDCIDLPRSGTTTFQQPLASVEHEFAACVRIITAAGAILDCSITTPFDLLDGRQVYAPQMLGEQVITDRGIETVASVVSIGMQRVSHNHLGGLSYAAGADPAHRIFSHNTLKS